MYYNVLALFFKIGIKCENHTASIILLKKIFGLDNDIIKKVKKERVDKQYYVDFSITKEEVDKIIKTAERFNAERFDHIESLNRSMIEEYRKNAREILI